MIHYRVESRLPRVILGAIDLGPALLAVGYAVRDKANIYPPRRHGSIRWRSERQRRYVLANVSLPYRRRGYLAKQWAVTQLSRTRAVVLNAAPYASFVIGKHQQPFHADTGWRRVDEVVKEVARDAQVKQDVITAIRRQLR